MSRAGYWYALHVAPRIDRVLIPRTNGRLSSIGVDTVDFYAGFDRYRVSCAPREIRIFRLRPLGG